MERRELYPEDEGIFETTPDTPALVKEFIDYGIDYEPNADMIPREELDVFSRPLMGSNSLAYQLFDEFKDSIKSDDNLDRFWIDLNIVPSPESTDETNIIENEYGDDYIVSDAYARYRMRLVAIQEVYKTPRNEEALRYRIVHIGVRDKLEKGNGFELFLNHDEGIDAGFAVDGRYCDRRPAAPEQQHLVAAMINELLNPIAVDGNGRESAEDPDAEIESDLQ